MLKITSLVMFLMYFYFAIAYPKQVYEPPRWFVELMFIVLAFHFLIDFMARLALEKLSK